MHGERYEVVLGSVRDGMFLELWERHPTRELALRVFFSDADGSFTTTRFRADVPPEVEAWFQAEARRRLPFIADAEPGAAADGGGLMGVLFGTERPGEGPALERVVVRLKVLSVVCWRGYQELLSREGQTFDVDEQGLLPLPNWIFDAQSELEPWEFHCLNARLGELPEGLLTQATWQCEGVAVLLWAVGLRGRPSYDSPVLPMMILETVEQSDYRKVRLPDPDELRDYAENLYSWQTRLREFSTRQEHIDFVAYAQGAGLDIGQLPLAANDLAIGKRPIAEDPDIVFGDDFLAVASERLRAAKWLSGLGGGIYSEVKVAGYGTFTLELGRRASRQRRRRRP